MKLTKVELIKVLIKYLDVQKTPIIENGLWRRNIQSEKDGTTLNPFVIGDTLDVLAAMIEDHELIAWPYNGIPRDNFSEKPELRYANHKDNSFILLLEEGHEIKRVICDVVVHEGALVVQQPPKIRHFDEVNPIRTPEGFLQYAEMMDDIEYPEDLINQLFHREHETQTGTRTEEG